jgi:hypothetical protein
LHSTTCRDVMRCCAAGLTRFPIRYIAPIHP